MSYLRSNPLAEHNSGIALSSKEIPQNTGTGNMYQGQAGREFVQGGGGASQYYSFNPGNSDSDNAHARGSYAPVSVGSNSVATGGGRSRKKKTATYRRHRRSTKCKKCKCDIIITSGGSRRHSRFCRHKCCNKSLKKSNTRGRRRRRCAQSGGSAAFANAAYSIGGAGTEVTRDTTALANPAPYTAYNSCHPVA
jgi:hypothetical protein